MTRRYDDDAIIVDARAKRAEVTRAQSQVHTLRDRLKAQRREAAELLTESREAIARNHFAEAILQSMRRKP